MTTETCRGALCGSTLQSSRRGGEAANADRALEEVRLRITAARMADHQPCGAQREEDAERPLHPRSAAQSMGPPCELERERRGQPAAEGTGEDIERPVHADHRARERGDARTGYEKHVRRTRSGADGEQAGDG